MEYTELYKCIFDVFYVTLVTFFCIRMSWKAGVREAHRIEGTGTRGKARVTSDVRCPSLTNCSAASLPTHLTTNTLWPLQTLRKSLTNSSPFVIRSIIPGRMLFADHLPLSCLHSTTAPRRTPSTASAVHRCLSCAENETAANALLYDSLSCHVWLPTTDGPRQRFHALSLLRLRIHAPELCTHS